MTLMVGNHLMECINMHQGQKTLKSPAFPTQEIISLFEQKKVFDGSSGMCNNIMQNKKKEANSQNFHGVVHKVKLKKKLDMPGKFCLA